MTYDATKIARELDETAIGATYHGNALRVAKDIPGLSADDISVLDRYATGRQRCTDHMRLQEVAIKIRGGLLPLTWRAQGEPNEYFLMAGGNWLASVKFNGELMPLKQEEYLRLWTSSARLLCALRELQANPNSPRAHHWALNATKRATGEA